MAFNNVLNSLFGRDEDDETYDMNDIIIRNTSIDVKNGALQYLLFEFDKETKPGSGKYDHIYKAIKLVKLKRVPKKDLTLASFLQMQEGVITGYYESQVNYIQIFANILKPQRLGLIFAYGCQGISTDSMEEAMEDADLQMAAVERGITGTFRTLEYTDLTPEDARWIFEKLGNMNSLRVIRGVPSAKKTNGRGTQSNFMTTSTADVEEQSEEFLLGMDVYEYLLVLTATSIDMDVISRWKESFLKEATYWASLQTGQKSMSFGLSMPMVYAANIGSSEGWGSNTGQSFGENWSKSTSTSDGTSFGVSNSESHGTSSSTSHSIGTSQSTGTSHGSSVGSNVGKSAGNSYGQNVGYSNGASSGTNSSYGSSVNLSHGTGSSENVGVSTNESQGWGTSHGTSSGKSYSVSDGTSHSTSSSTSSGGSSSWSSSHTHSEGNSSGTSDNVGGSLTILGAGANASTGTTTGFTSSDSNSSSVGGGSSWSTSSGVSNGTSHTVSNGTSTSTSSSTSQNNSNGLGNSYGLGSSISDSISGGVSNSSGSSFSQNTGSSIGNSFSANLGTSLGASKGLSDSTSVSNGISESTGTSTGISNSVSSGTSSSTSHSLSNGTSTGHSIGQSIGSSISGGTSRGTSSSMGMGPSLSFGRTFAWEDKEVTHIQDLLTYNINRLIMASNGEGAWFTDIMLATESEHASNAATQLAMSAWHGTVTLTSPLQVYKPSEVEQEYLFKHMAVFSPSTKREGIPGQFESYKYSTILLSEEIAAFSHPPRVNVGGIQAAIDDPPVLTIPGNRQNGEIFIGYVADVEKYNKHKSNGYQSDFRYTLRNDELHHAYISGASRSGKTVVARRLVAEAYSHCRRGEKKKRLRFLIMDPKQDWRALAKVIPSDHFRFYSLSNPLFHPIKMNLLKIPAGVYTERYADKLREIFIRSYGLGDRAFQILGKAINEVYREAGCFDDDVKYNLKDPVTGLYPATERSKYITMEDVCKKLQTEIDTSKQKDKQEAVQRILDRMDTFNSPDSTVYTIFCNRGEEGMGIDNLLGNDDVIVLESYGMDTKTSAFVFGLITSGVYQYAVSNGGFVKPDDQYETVLVIEEANQVLIGQDEDNLGGANPFEVILDQSAGYGLFIWTLTQKIADMPDSVLANSAIKIIGRQDRKDDIEMSIVQIGKDGLIADRVFKNWLPDQPTGWFIIKSSRNRDFTQNAPCHVLVEYMSVDAPEDDELDTILKLGEVERYQAQMEKEEKERAAREYQEQQTQILNDSYIDDSSTDYNVPDVDKFMEPKTSKESVQQPVYDPNQYDVQANTSTDGRFEPYSPYGTFSMDKKY